MRFLALTALFAAAVALCPAENNGICGCSNGGNDQNGENVGQNQAVNWFLNLRSDASVGAPDIALVTFLVNGDPTGVPVSIVWNETNGNETQWRLAALYSDPTVGPLTVAFQYNGTNCSFNEDHTFYVGEQCSGTTFPREYSTPAIFQTDFFNPNCTDQFEERWFSLSGCTTTFNGYGTYRFTSCSADGGNFTRQYFTDCNCTDLANNFTHPTDTCLTNITGNSRSFTCGEAPADICPTCVSVSHRTPCLSNVYHWETELGHQLCGSCLPLYQVPGGVATGYDGPGATTCTPVPHDKPIKALSYWAQLIFTQSACPKAKTFNPQLAAAIAEVAHITTDRITNVSCTNISATQISVTYTVLPTLQVATAHPVVVLLRVQQQINNPGNNVPIWTAFNNTYNLQPEDNEFFFPNFAAQPNEIPHTTLTLCPNPLLWKANCGPNKNGVGVANIEIANEPSKTTLYTYTFQINVVKSPFDHTLPIPQGTVYVFDAANGNFIFGGVLNSGGILRFTHNFKKKGTHQIEVVYYGNTRFARTSAKQSFTVCPESAKLPPNCFAPDVPVCCASDNEWKCREGGGTTVTHC